MADKTPICPIMSRPHYPPTSVSMDSFCQDANELDDGLCYDGVVRCQKADCIAWVPETIIDMSFIGDDPEVWARTKQTFAALSATGYVSLDTAGKLTIKPHCKFMESGKGGA